MFPTGVGLEELYSAGVKGRQLIRTDNCPREEKKWHWGSLFWWMIVVIGVHPNSMLELLLFLIYVNKLPDEIKSCLDMFADNTKIMRGMIWQAVWSAKRQK